MLAAVPSGVPSGDLELIDRILSPKSPEEKLEPEKQMCTHVHTHRGEASKAPVEGTAGGKPCGRSPGPQKPREEHG